MIITMSQTKGGVGKSTVGVHLAGQFVAESLQVGLLDADSQKSAGRWYERRVHTGLSVEKLEFKRVREDLRDTIDAMAKRNDVLIIDAGGYNSPELASALSRTNIAICPFRPKMFDLDEADRISQLIENYRFANPRIKSFALINQAPTLAVDSRADGAESYLIDHGFEVLKQRLYLRESYSDCMETGHSAFEYTDKKASAEIKALAEEIANA